jgi:hypothetical protein
MLAASVQHAHPRWDSLRGQRHICAGTRPHLRRDSPTSAPGLLYACRRRLARQSCGPVRQSRPAPMKMRRAQCCARGWRCATVGDSDLVRVSCVRVFVSVAPERSSSCCRCVAVNRRAMECALSTSANRRNAHDQSGTSESSLQAVAQQLPLVCAADRRRRRRRDHRRAVRATYSASVLPLSQRTV